MTSRYLEICQQLCRLVRMPRKRPDTYLSRAELSRIMEVLIQQQHRIEQLETETILLRRDLARHTSD